jgi:FXSXX-COOH protein
MNSAYIEPAIESDLIDLSAVSLDRLRGMNSSVLHHAMHHVLTRTNHLRGVRRSGGQPDGERVD